MKGRVHSFQSLGALDGPGLRFVVFMQGCKLRCLYCHNPDTWSFEGGQEYAPQEIFARVLRYKPYFGTAGGVTVSGGEPLFQAEFVHELFSLCRQNGIHTCLDTSGQLLSEDVRSLLCLTDLCLLDIKATSDVQYLEICGMDLKTPLDFLRELDHLQIPTWIRQVIVPGINDAEDNIATLNALLKPFSCVEKVELLAFHTLCVEKYRLLGIPFPLMNIPPMGEAALTKLTTLLTLSH